MFSLVTRVVAVLALVLSIAQLALGYAIATELLGPYEWALKRYANAPSSGTVIDRGFYGILISLCMGTLAEIGIAVQRLARRDLDKSAS